MDEPQHHCDELKVRYNEHTLYDSIYIKILENTNYTIITQSILVVAEPRWTEKCIVTVRGPFGSNGNV